MVGKRLIENNARAQAKAASMHIFHKRNIGL